MYQSRVLRLFIALVLCVGLLKSANSAVISMSDITRTPSGFVVGTDFVATLAFEAGDVMHAGDQFKITFLPWIGYRVPVTATIVNQVPSRSHDTVADCDFLPSVECAISNGFGGAGGRNWFSEMVITPLSFAAFQALIIQCPACAQRGFENLGIVQTSFTYTATSDITGPLGSIGFFLAQFNPQAFLPPGPVLCPGAQLVDAQGNLLLNADLGTPSLDVDCETLALQPHVLEMAPGGFRIEDFVEGHFIAYERGDPLPECIRDRRGSNLLGPTCAFVAIAIPEPATGLLLFCGLGALLIMRSKRLGDHRR
ncbi:MAG: PEP-CTERM sorting domain-containing protein [Pseudomonadota bacterium]